MNQRRHEIPPEFLDAADGFVTLANEMGDEFSANRAARSGEPQ